MFRRNLSIIIILAIVAALGFILFFSVRPTGLFRIATPGPSVAPGADLASLENSVSSTNPANVSATTLLQKPRYTGQDALGRNWLLQAESAGQEGTSTSGTYVLQQVQATFTDPSQTSPFTLSADQGRYAQSSSTLLLNGDVSASGIGFNMTAPTVKADLTTRKLQATGGSRVQGQLAGKGTDKSSKGWNVDITAPNLNADQNSSTLVLTGGVHARFTPTGK